MTPLPPWAVEQAHAIAGRHCQFHYTGPDLRPCSACAPLATNIATALAEVVGERDTTLADPDAQYRELRTYDPGELSGGDYRGTRDLRDAYAALRDIADVLVLFRHPGDDDCAACRVAKKHAAVLAQAKVGA